MLTMIDLNDLKAKAVQEMDAEGTIRVVVGMATCGQSAGARRVIETIQKDVAAKGLKNVRVVVTGCIGMCTYEPIVEVLEPGKKKVTYIHMDPEKASRVVADHLQSGRPVTEYTVGHDHAGNLKNLEDLQFYAKQKRIVLQNCGAIDPENIHEYIARDGYAALRKALLEMTPATVIEEMKKSGLRGRGGAGFPTGLKWGFAAPNQADQKYIICNADEGDPGAFMDRSVLEGDPHAILEAMALGGYAIGASKGYIYVRAEYPVAVERLKIAIGQARDLGLLGDHIFGSDFSFDIEIRLGAGAFVCGEETALIASIEGNRGQPRNRPPYPAVAGLFGCPTLINNVETFANVPAILREGAAWFASVGTEKSKGTKVFALAGSVNNTGLVWSRCPWARPCAS